MRLKFSDFSRVMLDDILPFSKTISNRTRKPKSSKNVANAGEPIIESRVDEKPTKQNEKQKQPTDEHPEYRENEMQIQMLSESLFKQIFRQPGTKLDANSVKA